MNQSHIVTFRDVTYSYPKTNKPVLRQININIPSQKLTLVIGTSGAGKSTLLRCINGLVPHFSGGTLSGEIRVDGLNPVIESPQKMSSHVGFVFQDPETQFVVNRVEDEIAFALENAAINPDEMHKRVAQVMNILGLTSLRHRRLETLSGGEMQRVAIAAALVLEPKILLLDEPTSQLDPHSAHQLLDLLAQLAKEQQLTVILAEHRLERILPFTDYLIHLDNLQDGAITGTPRMVMDQVSINPPLLTWAKALHLSPLPLTIAEGKMLAQSLPKPKKEQPKNQGTVLGGFPSKSPIVQAVDVSVSLGKKQILNKLNLELYSGKILVLMGANGTGKTTLLRTLIGILELERGIVFIKGQNIKEKTVSDISLSVGYLPQDPNALLFADRVMDELLITLNNHHLDPNNYQPMALLEELGLKDKAQCYPRDLSVGERQRVALGAITVTRPDVLLLDEPTRGLDYASKKKLIDQLHTWRESGMAILLVTHDVETAAEIADQVALLRDGAIVDQGSPNRILGFDNAFMTQIAQLYPNSGWLTVQDAIRGLHTSDT
jgi:energy-coupling factor transport system ATP-binding protein